MLRTIFSWIGIALSTTIFGILGVILSFISPNNLLFKYAVRPWGYYALKACGVKLDVEGLENLSEEPCVIMYNHQSAFDIFAFAAALPIPWKGVMKKEVARIPFVGWVTKMGGHYFVSRDGSIKDINELKKMVERIRSGPSVLIAPEGTRSPDGRLLPFKKGGFVLAMQAGVPVVPMVIYGGNDINPKGSKKIIPGTMKVKILPPINVKQLPPGKEGREELSELVRKDMERVLAEAERTKVAL
ncbi:MAG TPA: lysophospholipid acyltransferase family protein [Thermodesulfobacteriota bacterium]|nr:lysophospholipid acyltransferase family protein [Thermodesulfobacteriota bacterium]